MSCNQHLHLTCECTAVSNIALNGNKEHGKNCLLIRNSCLDNAERDVFIGSRKLTKIESDISDLKIDESFSNLENQYNKLVDSKLANLILNLIDKIEENNFKVPSKVVEKATSVVISSDTKPKIKSADFNISSSCRKQGIVEDEENTVDKKLVQTTAKVKNILQPRMLIPKSHS